MDKGWSIIKMTLRAMVWLSTPLTRRVGLGGLIVCAVTAFAAAMLAQYVEAGEAASFTPYGLNSAIAWIALALLVATPFARAADRATVLAVLLLLLALVDFAQAAFVILRTKLSAGAMALPAPSGAAGRITLLLLLLLAALWWIGAMLAIFRSVEPERRFATIGKVAGLGLALIVVYLALPRGPAFIGSDFDIRSANLWEHVRALREPVASGAPAREADGSGIARAQAALMDDAIAALRPQVPGQTDIYVVGLAGWSEQDVFIKELDGALDALAHSLPVEGRTLRLVNHASTTLRTPIATPENFAAAIHRVAAVMDRDEDVLLLFMTSHGSRSGVALWFPPTVRAELSPGEVAAVLDRERIRNRVVIVSACYAGVFIKPLANDNSIVLTAADDQNTSFGCSSERDWTYFGDAFFNRSLLPGQTMEQAFEGAKEMIAGWEEGEKLKPSNPQAHFGRALTEKLRPLYLAAAPTAAPPLDPRGPPPLWMQGVIGRPLGP